MAILKLRLFHRRSWDVPGQNALYRNNGNGTFTNITKQADLLQKHPNWGLGCTFVGYNRTS